MTNQVQFVGYVPNQQIGRYFSAADCFVLASLEETFPFALLEAMVYGLPVVSSRTWGPSEIVV
ncbi:MAG: glycosyltransferase, partial [Candidatus Caldarchaeum sp.]|nr:glycosyltransferase [Candidatus Caldarchaeum sp.]